MLADMIPARTALAHGILWLIGLFPVLIASALLPAGSLDNIAITLNLLGRLTGVAGLGLFLVAAIVSFRIVGFDRWFGGLTKLWKTHHLLGAAAFLLLLAHPLLLALANAGSSLDSAVSVLLPGQGGTAVWTGWVALLLMMIFLAPSFGFFGQPDYQRWKTVHRLSGPAALLAVVHTLMLDRALPSPWSSLIWLVLIAAAGVSLAYSLILKRRAGQHPYVVTEIDRLANNVVELGLSPAGRPLHHQAGQFVYLTHYEKGLANGCGEEHPYTISSSPDDPLLRVTIKALGDASHAIQQIATGTRVSLNGPYGAFFPSETHASELWIAGGIGITPFLGRARYLAGRPTQPLDIRLIYCVQDKSRALFAEELERIAENLVGFRISMHYFYRHGPLDADFLCEHCPDAGSREVYICGPALLLKQATRLVHARGVAYKNLHTEEFDLL